MKPPEASAAQPDQATTEEALEFSGIVLPPTAQVLGVEYEKGIDQTYVLAIAVDEDSIANLLENSGFTKPLQPGRRVFTAPVDEFNPITSTDVASAQERFKSADGTGPTVTRDIMLDRGDPNRLILHVWAYTT
ncbi:MAG: hypothetical protein ACT4NY_10005 [Pseudonocardiales bacterium]